MIKIQVKHKEVYGNDLMYICDPRHADIVGHLTGKKTVDLRDIENLRKLGCEVEDLDETLKEMLK